MTRPAEHIGQLRVEPGDVPETMATLGMEHREALLRASAEETGHSLLGDIGSVPPPNQESR